MKNTAARKEAAMQWLTGLSAQGECITTATFTRDAIEDQVSVQWLDDSDFENQKDQPIPFDALVEEMLGYVSEWVARHGLGNAVGYNAFSEPTTYQETNKHGHTWEEKAVGYVWGHKRVNDSGRTERCKIMVKRVQDTGITTYPGTNGEKDFLVRVLWLEGFKYDVLLVDKGVGAILFRTDGGYFTCGLKAQAYGLLRAAGLSNGGFPLEHKLGVNWQGKVTG